MLPTHPGIRVVLIAVHAGRALTGYHRPNAPLLTESYCAFAD
ncbi:hypothetical protein [Deinococcus apachensis]|nr:hypothetical protein [Deinococcus apachensis]